MSRRLHVRVGVSIALMLSIGVVSGAKDLSARPELLRSVLAFGKAPAPPVDTTIWKTYRWRSAGPDRGGRSIAIAGVKGQPNVGYFGATGGGLWKTTDGGVKWAPVTDGQITSSSVGAVAVSETNPDIIFIGTGESCIRGDIQPGDGVYKSTDAGKTWTNVGFRNSDAIAKIRIHPTDPNIVFVADFGKYGVTSEERGLFKSTDGGKTWRKVLYKGPETGAVDISIDVHNPNVMYAALWEAYRKEYQMSSGGPGSGLYKSTDGGETWTDITRAPGLPAGMDGKIGVAVSGADANRVYAIIENENGGLFRSDDAGASWTLANGGRNIRQRAFYYTHVAADPKNKDLVYVLNVGTLRSTDAGKTLNAFVGGDSHDLWIDPDNSDHVLHASDNGGAETTNASSDSRTWTSHEYPTGQFYHIVATPHVPYHICGSQQDQSELCIPSNAGLGGFGGRGGGGGGRGGAAPANYSPGGSEDGYIAPDPLDPDIFYSGTNANGGGFLTKLNRRTGETREVSPYPRMFSGEESAVIKERWQWTYPIIFSPVDPKVLYAGSQHLWKTSNGGQSWDRISPDLTRHDPKTMGPSGGPITRDMNGPEVYAVLFAVGPSKRTTNVIWTGSDDGIVSVTTNAGKTWLNVTPKDMPDFGRVSLIDASAFDSASAYVAVKRFLLDDKAPYIYRTHDMGKSWTKIVTGIRGDDFVHAVREDPTRKGLLYAGTQHGVYISYDDGNHWESLSLNLPDIPVWDLIVADHDVAIATHGRGFYILDNIGPLRQYTAAMSAEPDVVLFQPSPAVRASSPALIQYWLKHAVQNVRIDILDAKGQLVRTYPDTSNAGGGRGGAGRGGAPGDSAAGGGGGGGGRGRGGFGNAAPSKNAGLDSFSWDQTYAPAVSFSGMILWGGSTNGPTAPPGKYTVRLTADGKTVSQPFIVKRNPMHDATDADLQAQFALAVQLRDKVSEANNAVIQIRDLKRQVADRLTKSPDAQLRAAGDKLTKDLSAVEEEIYQVRNQSGQDPLNFPIKINNRLASLLGVVSRADARPIANAYPIFTDLKAELKVQTDRLQKVLSTELSLFNTEAKRLGLEVVTAAKPVVF